MLLHRNHDSTILNLVIASLVKVETTNSRVIMLMIVCVLDLGSLNKLDRLYIINNL